MIPWSKILGAGLVVYIVYLIYTGEVEVKDQPKENVPRKVFKRAEHPFLFWGIIVVLAGIAGLMLFYEPG